MEEIIITELLNALITFNKFNNEIEKHFGDSSMDFYLDETPDTHKIFYWYNLGVEKIYDCIYNLLNRDEYDDEVSELIYEGICHDRPVEEISKELLSLKKEI